MSIKRHVIYVYIYIYNNNVRYAYRIPVFPTENVSKYCSIKECHYLQIDFIVERLQKVSSNAWIYQEPESNLFITSNYLYLLDIIA